MSAVAGPCHGTVRIGLAREKVPEQKGCLHTHLWCLSGWLVCVSFGPFRCLKTRLVVLGVAKHVPETAAMRGFNFLIRCSPIIRTRVLLSGAADHAIHDNRPLHEISHACVFDRLTFTTVCCVYLLAVGSLNSQPERTTCRNIPLPICTNSRQKRPQQPWQHSFVGGFEPTTGGSLIAPIGQYAQVEPITA